nr:MAG TPA: hypothetical protein [Caudoviricetes sp.]
MWLANGYVRERLKNDYFFIKLLNIINYKK